MSAGQGPLEAGGGLPGEGVPGHSHASHDGADCSEVLLRVFEYIDQETTAEDGEKIRAHLDGCAQCLSQYQRDLLLKAIVRRSCAAENAPGRLREQIMSSLTTVRVDSSGATTSIETYRVIERVDTAMPWDRRSG